MSASAGFPSLTSSVRTCRVEAGEAPRLLSDRFLNPQAMLCPVWDGLNNKGQVVCPDSFYTKSRGCNSAEDRVAVENDVVRPDYTSYITLSAAGIQGHIYDNPSAHAESVARQKMLDNRTASGSFGTGQFGIQTGFGQNVRYLGCANGAYERAMAQEAQAMRGQGAAQSGYESYANRQHSGMNGY